MNTELARCAVLSIALALTGCGAVSHGVAAEQVLGLYISDDSTCASGHSVNVYSDGTVRYFATRVDVKPTKEKYSVSLKSRETDQQNYKLTPVEMNRISQIVSTFQLISNDDCAEIIRGRVCRGFRSGNQTEILTLVPELKQLASTITWARFIPDRDQCPSLESGKASLFVDRSLVTSEN